MIVVLVVFIVISGSATFAPLPLVEVKTFGGPKYLGEVVDRQTFVPSAEFFAALDPRAAEKAKQEASTAEGRLVRRKLRTGNFDVTQTHFTWINDCDIEPGGETTPGDAILIERLEWGRFYGFSDALVERLARKPTTLEAELKAGLDVIAQLRAANDPKFGEAAQVAAQAGDASAQAAAAAASKVYETVRKQAEGEFAGAHGPVDDGKAEFVADDGSRRLWSATDKQDFAAIERRWDGGETSFRELQRIHDGVAARRIERQHLEEAAAGRLNKAENDALVEVRGVAHRFGLDLGRHLDELKRADAAIHDVGVPGERLRRMIERLRGRPDYDQRLVPPLDSLLNAVRADTTRETETLEREKQTLLDFEKTLPAEVAEALANYRNVRTHVEREYAATREQIDELKRENERYTWALHTVDGVEKRLPVEEVVRTYRANDLSGWEKTKIYASRWREFLFDDPRAGNLEGGVYPAIVGTVVMTLLMSVAVVPFGVLAALYLREYAKPGVIVSFVRIAINNLAGVPSIVFGVFGLGFFCYIVGGKIDETLFAAESLTGPVFGKGALIWASLTLALMTLPVVIVATEESLAAVSNSMREGSYACGASKFQTICRIVLPRAMPGIMTGMILAMARGAGEVAPLMLVGALKNAEELPLDASFPFLHLDRSFMHLGFHIFDLGFQSQNSEAAKPMVFTTTLLLITIIFVLNLTAIAIRTRLRRKFQSSQF